MRYTDARWGVKREEFWLGYKLHVTETCDDRLPCGCDGCRKGCAAAAFPNLITAVATTDATVPDNQMTEPIHARLGQRGLLPGEHPSDFEDPRRVWSLLEPWYRPQDGSLTRRAVYEFRSMVAEQMCKGRVMGKRRTRGMAKKNTRGFQACPAPRCI